jgi:opacity protein-like surface antigen
MPLFASAPSPESTASDRSQRIRLLWIVAILVVGIAAPSRAQDAGRSSHVITATLDVHGGYTTLDLGEAEAFFQETVGRYQPVDVPIQRSYPNRDLIGLSLRVDPLPRWEVGIGGRYTSTEADALYGDYAGTLDVRSRTRMWTLEAITAYAFDIAGPVDPVAGARAGIAFAHYELENTINVSFDGVSDRATGRVDADGRGYTAGAFLGARYARGRITVQADAGYRLARVSRPGATIEEPNGSESGDLRFDLDYSGVVTTLGAAVRLGRLR